MKLRALSKSLMMGALAMGVAAGCTPTPEETTTSEPTPAPVVVDTTASKAAAAIKEAKAKLADAKRAGIEWRDTGKMIEKAEAALAAGDAAKALKIANQAIEQSNDAFDQKKKEDARYNANHLSSGEAALIGGPATVLNAAGKVIKYEVITGDNLWNIAAEEAVYANPYEWPLIYKVNSSKIKDPDLIYPGQLFDVDQNASASSVAAAIKHAKTRGAWSLGATEASDAAYLAK